MATGKDQNAPSLLSLRQIPVLVAGVVWHTLMIPTRLIAAEADSHVASAGV